MLGIFRLVRCLNNLKDIKYDLQILQKCDTKTMKPQKWTMQSPMVQKNYQERGGELGGRLVKI